MQVTTKAKDIIVSAWSDHKFEAILGGVAILGFPVAFYYTTPDSLSPSDLIQIYTLIILVIVTVSYAVSTRSIQLTAIQEVEAARQQTEASRDAVEAALRAERNAVMPIVKLTQTGFFGAHRPSVSVSNVGKGPALNLRLWVENDPKGVDDSTTRFREVEFLEVGLEIRTDVGADDAPLNREQGFHLVGQYYDIYGQGFRSTTYIPQRQSGAVRQSTFVRLEEVKETQGPVESA